MLLTSTHWAPNLELLEASANAFGSISLADLGHARLMNRTDTKFLLPARQLPSLLDALSADYRWLEVDGHRLCPYETLYYDTLDLRLYHDHQAGRLNRYKIRQRRYVQSDLAFTEVKHKTRKSRTIKSRIPYVGPVTFGATNGKSVNNGAGLTSLDAASRAFVQQMIRADNPTRSFDLAGLRPVLWVGYTRLTLVHGSTAERVTFDLNLTFRNADGHVSYPQLVVAELKQDAQQPSAFSMLMRQQRRRPGGLSKYCLGLISLDQTLKQNRFKPILRHLQTVIAQA